MISIGLPPSMAMVVMNRVCFHFCSGNWKAAINGNKVRIDRLDWGFYMYFNREIYKAAVINLEGLFSTSISISFFSPGFPTRLKSFDFIGTARCLLIPLENHEYQALPYYFSAYHY